MNWFFSVVRWFYASNKLGKNGVNDSKIEAPKYNSSEEAMVAAAKHFSGKVRFN